MSDFRRITEYYHLVQLVHSGAAGSVFRATDLRSGETVAVRLLSGVDDKAEAQRGAFELVAQTLLSLQHPGLPRTLDFGFTTAGTAFLVAEYCSGVTLDRIEVPEGASVGSFLGETDTSLRSPDPALGVLLQVAEALEALAGRGLHHGNLRADNVLLVASPPGAAGNGEQVKLLGLGSAAALARNDGGAADRRALAEIACHLLGAACDTAWAAPRVRLPASVAGLDGADALRSWLEAVLRADGQAAPTETAASLLRRTLGSRPAGVLPGPRSEPDMGDATQPVPRPVSPEPLVSEAAMAATVVAPAPNVAQRGSVAASMPPEPTLRLAMLQPPEAPTAVIERPSLGGAAAARRDPAETAAWEGSLAQTERLPAAAPPRPTPAGGPSAPLARATPATVPSAPSPATAPFARPAPSAPSTPLAPPTPFPPSAPMAPSAPAAALGVALAVIIAVAFAAFLLARRHGGQQPPAAAPAVATASKAAPRPAPPPAPVAAPRPPNPQLELAAAALASGNLEGARRALAEVSAAPQAELSAADRDRYQSVTAALASAGRDQMAKNLASGFSSGSLGRLNAALAAAKDMTGLPPVVQRDLERARHAVALAARLSRAQQRSQGPEVLQLAAELQQALPAYAKAAAAREEAAAQIETRADAAIDAGQYDRAQAELETLRAAWPDRPRLADRMARIGAQRQADAKLDSALAGAARAEQAGQPLQGLDLLAGAAPNSRYAERFRQQRDRLAAVLARLDSAPPKVALREGSKLEYDKDQPALVRLRVTDDFQVKSVECWARAEGGSYERIVVAHLSGADYQAAIPVAVHGNKPVELYVTAFDLSGHQGTLGNSQQPLKMKRKSWLSRVLGGGKGDE